MAMLMRSGSRRFGRSRRHFGRGRGRAGAGRKLTWIPNTFATVGIAPGTITEFNLATGAELEEWTLGRGTVVVHYGRIVVTALEGDVQLNEATFAWGIRLKEEDAAATGAAFSPFVDGDSSDWMTWRSGSIKKTGGAGTGASLANPLNWVDESFIIRNPRKIDRDEELVMLFETSIASTLSPNVSFWCRTGVILP